MINMPKVFVLDPASTTARRPTCAVVQVIRALSTPGPTFPQVYQVSGIIRRGIPRPPASRPMAIGSRERALASPCGKLRALKETATNTTNLAAAMTLPLATVEIAINRAVLTCLALVVIVTSKKVSTCLAKVVVVTRRMPNSQPARGAAAVRPAAWIAKLLFSIQVKVAMENAQSCRAIDSK